MKKTLSLFVAATLLVMLAACGSSQQPITKETPVAEDAAVGTFGANFTPGKVVPATNLLTAYSENQLTDTLQATLQGKVNEVCQAKGCWMTIAAGNDGEEMMVKFKDYGFFMPKDISGREVVMHGMAYYQITPVDELRHYAEDAGKSAEEIAKITEPKRELRFLADGVKLLSGDM